MYNQDDEEIGPDNLLKSEEEVVDNLIIPFLNWAKENTLSWKKESTTSIFSGCGGFVVGAVGIYAFYPLGGDFSRIVSNYFKIKEFAARTALYNMFAGDAIIPMIALSGLATKNHFEQIVSKNPKYPLQQKETFNWLRKGLIATAYVLGAFAAITPYYITSLVLKKEALWVQILLSIPAYIGGFMYKVEAEKNLLNRWFNYFDQGATEGIRFKRAELKKRVASAVKWISNMSDDKLEELFWKVMDDKKPAINYSEEETTQRLKHLFFCNETSQQSVQSKPPLPPSRINRYARNVVSGLGFLIGGGSGYVYYAIGQSAAFIICDWLNIHGEEERKIFSNFIASLVVIPWGALGIDNTQRRFEQIYDSIFNQDSQQRVMSHPTARKIIRGYSWFGGASAAIPLTYLAIENTKGMSLPAQILLVLPAFLAPTCIRANAIEKLLHNGIDWIDLVSGNSYESKRGKLADILNKISVAIDSIPDPQMTSLYNMIISKTLTTNKQEAEAQEIISASNTPITSVEEIPLLEKTENSRRTKVWSCGII